MDDLKQLKLVKNIYIVMSLLFCVLGIFLMARPKSSVKMLCVLMGIMLILYGAIKISGYFTRDAFCLAFQFDLAFGILLMAVGVILDWLRHDMDYDILSDMHKLEYIYEKSLESQYKNLKEKL